MLLPLIAGVGIGSWLLPDSELKMAQCLFLGTALSITAVPASIRVLMDLGKLHTRAGQTIVSAAIIDDVLSLILLVLLTGVLSNDGHPNLHMLLLLVFKAACFLGVTYLLEKLLVPRMRVLVSYFKSEEFGFSALLISACAYAVFAEMLGLHFIVGAFTAGLMFEQQHAGRDSYRDVKSKLNAITAGFMAPVFFASIGLNLDISAFAEIPWVVCMLVVVALVTKVIGAGGAAIMAGYTHAEAAVIGVGMSSRGMVELIIANIALQAGLFAVPANSPVVADLFSAVIVVAIITTILTPLGLRWLVRRHEHLNNRNT